MKEKKQKEQIINAINFLIESKVDVIEILLTDNLEMKIYYMKNNTIEIMVKEYFSEKEEENDNNDILKPNSSIIFDSTLTYSLEDEIDDVEDILSFLS